MLLDKEPVPAEARDIVVAAFCFESPEGLPQTDANLLFPHASCKVILPVAGDFSVVIDGERQRIGAGTAYLAGPWRGPAFLEGTPDALRTIVLVMAELGASRILGAGLKRLVDRAVPWDGLFGGASFPELGPGRPLGAIARDWLSTMGGMRRYAGQAFQVASECISIIRSPGFDLKVASLAERMGYSSRYIHAVFMDLVGISPKEFMATVRFHRALHDLKAEGGYGCPAGFYDQSHASKAFRHFTGLPPETLLRTQGEISRLFF